MRRPPAPGLRAGFHIEDFHLYRDDAGRVALKVPLRGLALMRQSLLNKGHGLPAR
jgi:hypothetical protein